jgi:hypothetical protein
MRRPKPEGILLDKLKSIAIPVTRRSAASKPRKGGHPQVAPDAGVGGLVGEPRRQAPPASAPLHHIYRIGQRLKLLGSGRYWARSAGLCRVVALLPHEGGPFLYRVRSEVESFERVVPEAELAFPDA